MITKLIPRKVFFTGGVGTHSVNLESFEVALQDAGIEKFNPVTVSSILPPYSTWANEVPLRNLSFPSSVDEHGDWMTCNHCSSFCNMNTNTYL